MCVQTRVLFASICALLATACTEYDLASPQGAMRGGADLSGADTATGEGTSPGTGEEEPPVADSGEELGDDDDDDDDDDSSDDQDADLPYDVRPQLGDTFRLTDAFLEEGPLPAAVLSVTMDDGTWRLAELQADTPFVIDQADCDHVGNRDLGRDRIFVTWQNADGSEETDHLDLRYCK